MSDITSCIHIVSQTRLQNFPRYLWNPDVGRIHVALTASKNIHKNKLESPTLKHALGQVWLKLTKWFRRRRFLVFRYNFNILLLSPLGKGCGPSFGQTWIPSTKGCFVPCLAWIGPVVLKKMKMWKVNRQTHRRTNRRRTKSDQKSSLELSALVSKKNP